MEDSSSESSSSNNSGDVISHVLSGSGSSEWVLDTPKKRKMDVTPKCYVVSRNCLRDWRRLRKNQWKIEKGQLNDRNGFKNGAKFPTDPENTEQSTTPKPDESPTVPNGPSPSVASSEESEENLEFVSSLTNEIICSHGKIDPDERRWVVVGEDAWALIEKYFPASDKLEPLAQNISNSSNQVYSSEGGQFIWEECNECRVEALKDASLSNHVKELLKPYDRALKELQKMSSIQYPHPKLSFSIENRKLIAVPKTIIGDFRDLISDLRSEPDDLVAASDLQQLSLSTVDTQSKLFLTVDYSPFYCDCPAGHQGLTIPVRLEGPSHEKEELEAVIYFEKEYFVIGEQLFDLLRQLRVQFDSKLLFFDPYPIFVNSDSLSSNNVVQCNSTSSSISHYGWTINRDVCESCWLALRNKYITEKYHYFDKILYFVQTHRLDSVRTHKLNEDNIRGRRVLMLHGAISVSVDSTDSILDVKKKLAPRINKLASCIELLKYDSKTESMLKLEEDYATLESLQILANTHLIYDEKVSKDDNENFSKLADTDASYFESGFSGSNLLSTKSPSISNPSVRNGTPQSQAKQLRFAIDCNIVGEKERSSLPVERQDESTLSEHVLDSISSVPPCHYSPVVNEASVYAYPVSTAASDM